MRRHCARRPIPIAFFAAVAAIGLSATGSLAQGLDPSGVYITESGVTRMRVARCGTGYCGSIVSTGGSGIDSKNPNPALRTRKLAGVQILQATAPSGSGYSGTLYNPNDGKTYAGSLTPKDADRLEVAGCVLRVLCKRQIWTRAK